MRVSDITTETLRAALTGLDARRQAFEANIANVETPGYTAVKVEFEDALRAAVADGNPADVAVTTTPSTEPARLNGNNVDVGQEMVGATETALREELVVAALNNKYRLIRASISGGQL